MFRSNANQNEISPSATTESYDERNALKSDTGTFSFFGFNFFEADETLQKYSNNGDTDEDMNHEDESVREEVSVRDTNSITEDSNVDVTTQKSKRLFWERHSRRSSSNSDDTNKGNGVVTKIKGKFSQTLGSIKNVDYHLVERIRSSTIAQRTGKIFHRSSHTTNSDEVMDNNNINKDETRDDHYGLNSFADSLESFTSRDNHVSEDVVVVDEQQQQQQITEKRCFPSWPLKKVNSITVRNMEQPTMETIQETELPVISSIMKSSPSNDYTTTSIDRYTPSPHQLRSSLHSNHHDQRQQNHHHRRHASSSKRYSSSSSRHYDDRYATRKSLSSSKQPPRKSEGTSRYVKASNYDNNIWDDQSASSGWFSLESLDAM